MTDALMTQPSTVGVYSPSGACADTSEKVALLEKGLERLATDGFTVIESDHCRESWFNASAPPEARVADLLALCRNPAVDAIIPSIGGHTASQLLPHIDFETIASSGKKLFGFSDNSIIPLALTSRTGTVTYHAACDVTFGFGRFAEGGFEKAESSFIAAVKGEQLTLDGKGWQPAQRGTASGILLGGNLKGLASLLGTPWSPDWSGKVMFWESMDQLHVVLQNLTQLSNAGVFDGLAAMIVGRVDTLEDSFYGTDKVVPVDEYLLNVLNLRGRFPIVMRADIGHNVDNLTWPLGRRVTVRVDDGLSGCTFAD